MDEPSHRFRAKGLVLLGGGGHALVLAEAAGLSGWAIEGHLGPRPAEGAAFGPHLGDDAEIVRLSQQGLCFAAAFGFVNAAGARRRAAILDRLVSLGLDLPAIRHPSVIVSPSARLGPGSFVAAGAVLAPGCEIGLGAIINTGAIVEHGSRIGTNTHVASGARLAGDVRIDSDVLLGIGCILRQGIHVGAGAVIGAGAVVVRDVPPGAMVMGNPARTASGMGRE